VVCHLYLSRDEQVRDGRREALRGMKRIVVGIGLSSSDLRAALQHSFGRRWFRTFGMVPQDLVRSV
jgi:hypothetical protein